MSVIVKPNIEIENIEIQMDTDAEYGAERLIHEQGRNIPLIKIGKYVLGFGELKQFSLNVALNTVPTFTMNINDDQYVIRESLKEDIDKCVIFLGFKDFYVKFNGLIQRTYSDVGDAKLILTGIVFNQKIYEGKQLAYKDKTVADILKDLADRTSMGLFTIDNPDLNKVLDYSISIGYRFYDFMEWVLQSYTNNVFSIDPNYYIHVADIDTLRKQPIDKYLINWSTGLKNDKEQDLIFKSIVRSEESTNDGKIPIEFYTINSIYGETHVETYADYTMGVGGNGVIDIPSNTKLGLGSQGSNTFFGFKNHKNPFYKDKINKLIGGTSIRLYSDNVIFELVPFNIVGIELYLPYRQGEQPKLDTDHSGKKIVIGYSIDYLRPKDISLSKLTQTIDLI